METGHLIVMFIKEIYNIVKRNYLSETEQNDLYWSALQKSLIPGKLYFVNYNNPKSHPENSVIMFYSQELITISKINRTEFEAHPIMFISLMPGKDYCSVLYKSTLGCLFMPGKSLTLAIQ